MSFSSKAIIATILLSASAATPSAQGFPVQVGPDGTVQDEVRLPSTQCGAYRLQAFVGHHVDTLRGSGMPARYFTPDMPFGTMDYQPHRLNVSTNANYIIDRVYCG